MTNGQKRPIRVVSLGDSPFPDLVPKADAYESNKNCFYFIRLIEPEDTTMAELALRSEIPKDQILFFGSPSNLPPNLLDSRIRFLLNFPEESKSSFKTRLQATVEEMRNGILASELDLARDELNIGQLAAEDWLERQGATHIAHSITKNLDLTIDESRTILRATLRRMRRDEFSPVDQLSWAIIDLSFKGWKCKSTPIIFREEFRQQISNLSFKQKSELREAFETSLEKFWGQNEAA